MGWATITARGYTTSIQLQNAVLTDCSHLALAGMLRMVQRYRSVLSALQYSIVHLFGDYPETDYTVEAACQLNARTKELV